MHAPRANVHRNRKRAARFSEPRRPFSVMLAAVCVACAVLPLLADGQQPRASEYQVKAAYLFNFSRFVSWPAQGSGDASAPFSICVMGKDPFGQVLDATVAGENIGGKSVVARRLAQAEQPSNCRVLFISSSEESRLREILAALDKASVLTVSDIAHFAERGGMIQFVLQDNRVRFEVNLASATGAKLTLSSELLKVAVEVRKGAPPGQ